MYNLKNGENGLGEEEKNGEKDVWRRDTYFDFGLM
jgi:hypothetical protein